MISLSLNFKKMLAFGLLLAFIPATALTAERSKICLLPFRNVTGNEEQSHWQKFISEVLVSQVQYVKSVQIISENSVAFAFRETRLDPGQKIEPDNIHTIAELLKADYVVAAGYSWTSNLWKLSAQLYIVAKDKTVPIAPVTSPDLQDAVGALRKHLLVALNIPVRPEVERLMDRKMTDSPEALRLASQALWSLQETMAIPMAREQFLKATSLDPDFAVAQCGLAECLKLEGKYELAKDAATKALAVRPDSAWAYSVLAGISEHAGRGDLAERQYRHSIRLDPDSALTYFRLGDCLVKLKKWAEAHSILVKAKELEPYNALIHGELAITYARLANRRKALMELKIAEQYDDGDPGVQQVIAIGYEILGEAPLAIAHYESFLAKARKAGFKTPAIGDTEKRVEALKARVIIAP